MFYPNNLKAKNEGYIAVVSAVIITSIVIIIALVFSSSNFLGRSDNLSLEMKDVAREVAEGCLEYARLKLSLNSSYSGNETRAIGTYSCTVLPIETPSGQYVIKASSTVSNKSVKLKLTIDNTDLNTVSLEELANF